MHPNYRAKPLALIVAGLLGLSGAALAAVSEQDAAQLGKDLTPVGAERAGNKDGSIPKWEGGLPKGKHKVGDARVDPFAADKPLYSIDASNVDKYKDKLSAGQIELIKTRKGYRMDIYPTHRSCGYPDSVYGQTKVNATTAKLTSDGKDNLAQAVGGGFPFAIPKNGAEAVWNHRLRWQGEGRIEYYQTNFINPDGSFYGLAQDQVVITPFASAKAKSTDFAAANTVRTPLDDEAKKAMTQNVSLLDLWVSKDFKVGDNSAKFKFGNQVINWGEDIFIFGGINTIHAFDLRKAHIPGTQVKEILIPAPMASLNMALGGGFSTEMYYQFAWNSFKLDPAGTYWSTADFIGKGGKRGAFIPSSLGVGTPGDFDPTRGRSLDSIYAAGGLIPVEQTKPGNDGQYGLNLRYKQPGADTEFAAYYIRYHDKLPFVGFKINSAITNAFGGIVAVEQYGENKELFGFSANTKVGDWAFGTELSYRPRDSVAIDPTVPLSGRYSVFSLPNNTVANGYVNEKKYQGHVTAFTWLPPELTRALGAADGAFLAEVAVAHYPGLKLNGEIPYLLNNYELPTKTSWGYVMEVSLTYANVFNSGWTATPIVDFYHDVKGTSPNTIPFVEGRKALAVGLNFDYHNQWKVGLGYSSFFGGGNLNLMRDRDIASMTVSYTF